MKRNISILLKLIAALCITWLRRLANACLSTQLQDYRALTTPQGNCIEIADCAGGVIIEEIKVCLDTCPTNTTILTDPNWLYDKCVCSLARISSNFSTCSDKCPGSQVAQQNSKLCLQSLNQCGAILTQDRTMCGQNVCISNQYLGNGNKLCLCYNNVKFFDQKTNSCMTICPINQITSLTYNLCLVTDTDCKDIMSSDQKTCGSTGQSVCKQNEYITSAGGNKPYQICQPCPEAFPLSSYGSQNCYNCFPSISDLTNGNCLWDPSQCSGSKVISSDGKRCSYTCKVGEYAAQEAGYLLCRDMSQCPLVDIRVSPNVCLSSFENCKGGFISIDEKSCLNICPYEQYSTETVLIPQGFKYNKCVNKMGQIVLISVGFALITSLCSFLLCYGIIKAKIATQESKYIRDLFPTTTEEDDISF